MSICTQAASTTKRQAQTKAVEVISSEGYEAVATKGAAYCAPFCVPCPSSKSEAEPFRKNGGHDETRARDLCRDTAARNGFTTTYETADVPGRTACPDVGVYSPLPLWQRAMTTFDGLRSLSCPALERAAIRTTAGVLSLPKTSERNPSSRFLIVDGKISIRGRAFVFSVNNKGVKICQYRWKSLRLAGFESHPLCHSLVEFFPNPKTTVP